MKVLEEKLAKTLYECALHVKRIHYAVGNIDNKLPITVENYELFSDRDVEHVDQFLFRFAKLQDAMGERLFPTVLLLLEENINNKAFIDILNRLEKLGLVDKNHWVLLRKIRNSVSHEYGFNVVEVVESLNAIYKASAELIEVYKKILNYCGNRFGIKPQESSGLR